MATKRVLACVVQWRDGDESRLEISGWSDCPHQREQIRKQTLENLGGDPRLIEAVRFIEIDIPLVDVSLTDEDVAVRDVA